MPSCLLTGVRHLNSWSFKGDNHHKDSMFSSFVNIQQNRLNTSIAESRSLILFSAYLSKNLTAISKSAAMLAYSQAVISLLNTVLSGSSWSPSIIQKCFSFYLPGEMIEISFISQRNNSSLSHCSTLMILLYGCFLLMSRGVLIY